MERFNINAKLMAAVACVLVVTMFFFVGDHQFESQIPMDNSSQLSVSEREGGSSNKTKSNSEISFSKITEISSATDILDLNIESKFSFRIGKNGEDGLVVMKVTDVSNNPTFTQIQARGEGGELAVMTLTPTLTNILLKTSDNIFEYIGDNFDGSMSQVAQIDISEDIHGSERVSEPIKNTFEPKRVMER
jgi:hypothetical protein